MSLISLYLASDISFSAFLTFHLHCTVQCNLLTCMKVEMNPIVLYIDGWSEVNDTAEVDGTTQSIAR